MDKIEYVERAAVLSLQHRLYHSPLSTVIELSPTYIISPDAVQRIPAADVAPVIHGILKYSPQDDIALCSKCGEEIYLGALHQFAHNYCPNCGAKMDSE